MNNDLMFSSKTDLHETPQIFFDKLNEIYQFGLDVCADWNNAKCFNYFTKEQDGLSKDWVKSSSGMTCWMNPPYGREIGKWMKKAYESSLQNAKIVYLIPTRTNTTQQHDHTTKNEIKFLKKHLKFDNSKNPTPFPNTIIIFKTKK